MAQSSRTIRDGLIVGIIGYFSVAALYAAFDLLAARGGLYTVDLLAKSLFEGLRDTAILGLPIERDMMGIFWYNGLHLVISLTIGLVVTGLVVVSERRSSQARIVLFTIVAGFIGTVAGVGLLTSPISGRSCPGGPSWSPTGSPCFLPVGT